MKRKLISIGFCALLVMSAFVILADASVSEERVDVSAPELLVPQSTDIISTPDPINEIQDDIEYDDRNEEIDIPPIAEIFHDPITIQEIPNIPTLDVESSSCDANGYEDEIGQNILAEETFVLDNKMIPSPSYPATAFGDYAG